MHAGAGAYICGEETALLDSLEGRRGQPRLRPPFPAVAGLYACRRWSTTSESIASVPPIMVNGVDWFKSMGTEKSPGFTLYSLSGHVTRPGQYEAPLGITLRRLLDYAGGVGPDMSSSSGPGRVVHPAADGRTSRRAFGLRGNGFGGLDAGHQGAADLRRDDVRGARGAPWTQFYAHESCGKVHAVPGGAPTGCAQIYERLETGRGRPRTSTSCSTSPTPSSASRSARSVTAPPRRSSSLKHFRAEYEAHLAGGPSIRPLRLDAGRTRGVA